jgi:hypothetical protein
LFFCIDSNHNPDQGHGLCDDPIPHQTIRVFAIELATFGKATDANGQNDQHGETQKHGDQDQGIVEHKNTFRFTSFNPKREKGEA